MAAAAFVERSSGEQPRPERPWHLVGFREMAGDPSIPEPPRLPEQLERAEVETLAHDDVYTETTLRDLDLSEQEANGVELRGVALSAVSLAGSRLDQLKVSDGAFAKCELSNLHGQGIKASRVAIERSRLTGIVLQEAALDDITVRGCRVDLSSLAFSRLARDVRGLRDVGGELSRSRA